MVAVLLVWILVAPLGAWIIGGGIRLAEQRRLRPVADVLDEAPCQQADVEELAAVG